jgi:hypothetical protein
LCDLEQITQFSEAISLFIRLRAWYYYNEVVTRNELIHLANIGGLFCAGTVQVFAPQSVICGPATLASFSNSLQMENLGQGVVTYTYNLCTWEAEAGRL